MYYVCMYVCMYACMCVCVFCVCMYVCMYVRTYVCMYVCIYVRTYVCMYVLCTYVCIMYVCMYLCTYACTYVCMYICVYVHTYVSTYACTYVRMYVCMYVCRRFVADGQYSMHSTVQHFTRSPKHFIALSRLPVDGFSRNFALRPQRTFATYSVYCNSLPSVKQWGHCVSRAVCVSSSLSATSEGIFKVVYISHATVTPSTHWKFCCDWQIINGTLHDNGSIFSPEYRPPVEGFSWKHTSGTRRTFPIHVLNFFEIGHEIRALYKQTIEHFRVYQGYQRQVCREGSPVYRGILALHTL